jgi:hypothetical protein
MAWVFSAYPVRYTTLARAADYIAAQSIEGAPYTQRSAAYAAGACNDDNAREFAATAANYAIEALSFSKQSFEDMLDACSIDADMLDQRTSPVTLANAQLWPRRPPDWFADDWEELKQALLADDNVWWVWTDWYDDRLNGRPGSQTLELARASIADERWEQEPALLNAHIQELLRQHGLPRKVGESDLTLNQLVRLKPKELSLIGVRVALRVVPLLKLGPAEFETSFISALRAISSTWTWVRYSFPSSERPYLEASRSRVPIVRDISHVVGVDAMDPKDAPFLVSRSIDSLRAAILLADGDAGASVFDLCLTQD